jgi:hypothetical protein
VMGALADIYSRMILKAANPLWEGDKFQPPGQPRGKGGHQTLTRMLRLLRN